MSFRMRDISCCNISDTENFVKRVRFVDIMMRYQSIRSVKFNKLRFGSNLV